MTTLLAHIRIRQGKEARFESIMQAMVEETFAKEAGVLRYEYFKGQEPNLYYCLLAYEDKWGFYRHQMSEHHERYDFAEVIEAIELEYLDPVADANPLPPTRDPPLTAYMDESMARAASLYPVSIADWWDGRE